MRKIIKKLTPRWALKIYDESIERLLHRSYKSLPVEQVFARIYAEQRWGYGESADFYSGHGSHDPALIDPYIRAVLAFLASRPARPVIVDLGCGDFNVGAHFVNFSREYYACDIVPELLTHNRQHFAITNLYFSCINIIEDELPDGDIVFIRQVFQHLGNAQITKVMDKCRKYMTWVVTEHLPVGDSFTPNIDMSAGCGIRVLVNNSGIVLTAPPFNMLGYKSEILCEIPDRGGIIRTTIFEKLAA